MDSLSYLFAKLQVLSTFNQNALLRWFKNLANIQDGVGSEKNQ
jgi:hypothetical protein